LDGKTVYHLAGESKTYQPNFDRSVGRRELRKALFEAVQEVLQQAKRLGIRAVEMDDFHTFQFAPITATRQGLAKLPDQIGQFRLCTRSSYPLGAREYLSDMRNEPAEQFKTAKEMLAKGRPACALEMALPLLGSEQDRSVYSVSRGSGLNSFSIVTDAPWSTSDLLQVISSAAEHVRLASEHAARLDRFSYEPEPWDFTNQLFALVKCYAQLDDYQRLLELFHRLFAAWMLNRDRAQIANHPHYLAFVAVVAASNQLQWQWVPGQLLREEELGQLYDELKSRLQAATQEQRSAAAAPLRFVMNLWGPRNQFHNFAWGLVDALEGGK
jgi:hypothetical protein